MTRLATIAAFGFSDFNPPTLLPVYKRMGCQTMQFYRNPRRPPQPRDALALAQEIGVPFDSVHGLFGPEHDPSSPDEPTRQAAMRTYREEGELSLQLNGPMVVVHPAPMAPDPTLITPATRQVRQAPMQRSMEQLARIGEELGVTYLVENIPGNFYFGTDAPQLGAMVRELGSPHVRMCFDTGHANMTHENSVADDLAACLDVIAYLHISDNDGTTDSHLIPGRGTVPWDSLTHHLAELPAGTPCMLELFYSEEDMRMEEESGLGDRVAAWLAVDQSAVAK